MVNTTLFLFFPAAAELEPAVAITKARRVKGSMAPHSAFG